MKLLTTLFCSLMAFLTLLSFLPSASEVQIYGDTVRLHVIANSDSERDQELKLKVRDRLLEKIASKNFESKEKALSYLKEHLAELETLSQEVLRENGCDDTVQIVIGEETYEKRVYDRFSLPAGTYTSVRVLIGEGNGKNWWCVLFPPLCVQGALVPDETAVGLTKSEYELITGQSENVQVKFKLLELCAQAFGFSY